MEGAWLMVNHFLLECRKSRMLKKTRDVPTVIVMLPSVEQCHPIQAWVGILCLLPDSGSLEPDARTQRMTSRLVTWLGSEARVRWRGDSGVTAG